MARLNPTNTQATRSSPRKTQPAAEARRSIQLGCCEENPVPKPSKQKQKKASGTLFEIFSDDAQPLERTKLEAGPSSKTPSPTKKKTRTLNLARTNSLLLPVQQRPQQRPNFKIEADDYDKENDLAEYGTDSYSAATSPASHQSPAGRSPVGRSPIGRSTTPVPARTRTADRPMSYLGRGAADEDEDEEDAGDTSFDSLDDFIVSDNDDISFHSAAESASDSEVEVQKSSAPPSPPSPPKSTRRRLIRGRRPGFHNEGNKNRERSPNNFFPLEVKVPEAMKVLSSPKVSDETNDLATKFGGLEVSERVGSKGPAKQNDLSLSSPNSPNSGPPSIHLRSSTPSVDLTESVPQTPTRRPTSPTKQKSRIPPTPHRESTDAFWSQDVTNDWIDQHSPDKPATMTSKKNLPSLNLLNDFDSSDSGNSPTQSPVLKTDVAAKQPKTPSKTAIKKAEVEARKAEKARKQDWENRKVKLGQDFIRELDLVVSNGRIAKASDCGYIPIQWSATLRQTAGKASTKGRLSYDNHGNEIPQEGNWNMTIVLASHVITDMHRLVNTLTHEYCHIANDIITRHTDRSHGPSFKAWGVKCAEMMKGHSVYGEHAIHVTTKHDYQIDWKYQWTCQRCGKIYGRHSKSIDPSRARCKCSITVGFLQQTKPKPRNTSPQKSGLFDSTQKSKVPEVSEEVRRRFFNYPDFVTRSRDLKKSLENGTPR